jgi:hypothetical protein
MLIVEGVNTSLPAVGHPGRNQPRSTGVNYAVDQLNLTDIHGALHP